MADINTIRKGIERYKGSCVRVTTKEGRNRCISRKGTIESIYPSLFVVRFDKNSYSEDEVSRVSYSYTDVLTSSVKLAVYK